MKKIVFICAFVIFTLLISFTLWGALLLNENFDYTAGQNLTDNGWTAHSGAGTEPITISSGGLSYSGYASSGIGNAALVDNFGEDDNRSFDDGVSSGVIYTSFLVNVSTDSAPTGYFLHLSTNPLSTTYFRAKVFVQADGEGFKFGLSMKNNTATGYSSAAYDFNVTYLLVVKYEFVDGDGNDEVNLFIFSSGVPSTEPVSPALGPFSDTTEPYNLGTICLRQFISSQNSIIDGIRVGTTWAEATLPVALSSFTAQYLNSKPTLYWQTQSEEDNMGWFIYRNTTEDFTSAEKITGMIDGHGTTTQPQSYIYEDAEQLQVEQTYYYWLESVDYSGTLHHFNMVAQVTIPHSDDPGQNVTPPVAYDITADPNPFSYSTEITFAIDQISMVDVAIYNVKGQRVKSFGSVMTNVDEEVSFHWNGKDNAGKALSNGVYLYSVKVNGKDYATKQLILMK